MHQLSITLIIAAAMVAGCSLGELKETEIPKKEDTLIGVILDKQAVTLEPNESKAARVGVGLLGAGIIGGISSAVTEDDFSEPKAWQYVIKSLDDQNTVLISRSIMNLGDCVEVVSYEVEALPIMKAGPTEACRRPLRDSTR